MELETKRLYLRPFIQADAVDLYDYAKDPRVGPAAGWRPHASLAESQEIIRTVFCTPYVFAMVLKETGRVIGSAGFTGRHRKELRGPDDEIGYSLAPEYWGQGLVPEAVKELIRFGFENRGLQTIWCCHDDGNIKSKRVIRKCGFPYRFLRVTEVRELNATRLTLCYAMKQVEWEASSGKQTTPKQE